MHIVVLLAAVALAAATSLVSAATLEPARLATIDLGSAQGSASYTVAPDGYHLVATLQSGLGATPIRFGAVLADGQSVNVSVPGPAGAIPADVTFSRRDNRIEVRQTHDGADVDGANAGAQVGASVADVVSGLPLD